mgnify:CR=1 FL=1
MPVVTIPFDQPPSNISASHGRVTQVTRDVDAAEAQAASDALRAMQSIENELQAIHETMHHACEDAQTRVMSAAIRIAKEALGSENDLIEQQVTHFADVLMQQLQPAPGAVAFVHPSCLQSMQQWKLNQKIPALEIQGDASVAAGDCRIEVNGKGLLASLDAFLDAAARSREGRQPGEAKRRIDRGNA